MKGFVQAAFIVWIALSGPGTRAHADEVVQEFEGIVQFEARRTLVPMVYCQDIPGHCPVSEPYWTLSLVDSPFHVEWSQPLAYAQPQAPKSIKVRGKRIKPGDRVLFRGNARRIAEEWYVIDQLRDVEILPHEALHDLSHDMSHDLSHDMSHDMSHAPWQLPTN